MGITGTQWILIALLLCGLGAVIALVLLIANVTG